MKYKLFFLGLLSCFLAAPCYSNAPSISKQQAFIVVQQFLSNQVLYWSPIQFPVQIERKSKSRLAKQLDALFKAQQLNREKGKKWVNANNISEHRERISLYWDYALDNNHSSGFAYGNASLKRIEQLSKAKNYAGEFYIQMRISWYVENMPAWSKRPEFHSVRLLRRSKESFSKPFIKSLYLHYKQGKWVVWQPKT